MDPLQHGGGHALPARVVIVEWIGNRRSLVRKRTGPKSGLSSAYQLA
ncbi:hypothetical protein RHECNPAF_12210056 [Rhizobium etli CNPAF512]|nr:hypothetical protein RHECNPAF_12210056 [Rhizobium etli CNPAF512]